MSFKKRLSLREKFDQILDMDEETAARYRADTMKELEALHEEAQTTWTEQFKTCSKCEDDDDVDVAQEVRWQREADRLQVYPTDLWVQEKEYASAAEFNAHLQGPFHKPASKWMRYAEKHCVDDDGDLRCPYCSQAGILNAATYESVELLVKHVNDSNPANTNQSHDELKTAAGWYTEEFQQSLAPSMQDNTAQSPDNTDYRRLLGSGILLTPGKVMHESIPHPTLPGVSIGPPPTSQDPADLFPDLVSRGLPTRNLDVIPPHLEGIIGKGYPKAFAEDPSIVSTSKKAQSTDWEMMTTEKGEEEKRGKKRQKKN